MKKQQSIILSILTFLLLSGCNQNGYSQTEDSFPEIQEVSTYLQQQAEENLFSGAVLLQSKDGVLMKEAYGMANKETVTSNDTDTKFNIGSINKVFTSICVMQLVEAGNLSLEDKIVDYIPELTMPMADEITIQHLLAMQSGLGSYWDSELFDENLNNLYDLEDYLPIISAYELSAKPGTKRQYSNSGYELLGILVQRVSGENYYDYVKKNVFQKVGMSNTDAFERDQDVPNLAQGYSNYAEDEMINFENPKMGDFEQNVNDRHAVKGTAAGGGYSTLDDLYKFLIALQNNELLSEQSTDMVINRFRDFPERQTSFNFRGGSHGINAVISYDANKEIAIVVLSNYDPPTASHVANRLIEMINKGGKNTAQISDKEQIEQVVEQFQQGIETKNLEEFLSLFVEESKVSWVGNGSLGQLFGSPSEFIQMLQSTDKNYREDFHNLQIWNDDLIAVVTFDYGFFGNEQLSNWGKESWMLIKQNGDWKITSVNFSMILPQQQPYPYQN